MSDSPHARVTLAPASQSKAWSEVSQTGDTSYRIRLEGPFGPAWIASLCAELADRQISIDRAHAMRTSNQTWVAELNVEALPGAADPLAIAYVELAEAGAPDASDPLKLLKFEIEETSAHGGSLQLTVEAEDSLGLLGSLLSQLAMLFLFPVEMHIETSEGRAHDVFWLCTVGASPGPRLRDAASRVLSRALLDS
ncbi:MAG TPA: hypothetical protein VFX59_30580 [Polyangiales bacterium]|nr:hypothetical protein [Polyangiales bacterium]